jgi:hypothetical protein
MLLLRAVFPAVVLAWLVVLAGLLYVLGYRTEYHALLQAWGAFPFRFPFLDMHAVTAAVDCHRQGFDVYVDNPCDVFHRVHGYSPLWLWLSVFPITTGWDSTCGLAAVMLLLLAVASLPPGRGWWQVAMISLGTISSAVAFALERANVDLLMFAMAAAAIALVRRWAWLRMLGYAVALLAGMLKFYPITLLILAVRERLLVFVVLGITALGVIAAWFALDGNEILRAMANIPVSAAFDNNAFGMRNLPLGLTQYFALPPWAGAALLIALPCAMLAVAVALARRDDLRDLTANEATCLLVGAVLIVTCFLAAQNIQYRAIHLLFALPGLTALARQGDVRCRVTVVLAIILMWSGAISAPLDAGLTYLGVPTLPDSETQVAVWLARELMWWCVVTMLAALMFRLVWDSRARRDVAPLWSSRRFHAQR